MESQSIQACPRCGEDCQRDEVHNGIAMLHGPWGCSCGWSEDSRYDQQNIAQPASGHIDQFGGFTPSPAGHCEACDGEGLIECPACRGFGDANNGSLECEACKGRGHKWCAACGGKGEKVNKDGD